MALSEKQKAVIENDFVEKAWVENPSFKCSRIAVHNLIKKNKRNWIN